MTIIIPIAMGILLLATMALFAYSANRRIKPLKLAAPADRFNNYWKRIDQLVIYMFGQKKLFKLPLSGLMHALVFWGFLILLLRSTSLIGSAFFGFQDGFMHWDVFWFWPKLSHIYTLCKDITEVVVLSMILIGYFRRLVIKPKRLTLNWDANLVLGLIGMLMITDFLLDGSKFLTVASMSNLADAMGATSSGINPILLEMQWAPIGALVAKGMAGMGIGPGTAYVIFQVNYWLHLFLLFFFLNFLPYSKHFHVLTVFFNVFFSNIKKGKPLDTMKNIEEEFEKEEPVIGVTKLEHMPWPQILNAYTCIECGRCTLNCPADMSGKPLSPKVAMEELKHFVDKYEPYMFGNKEPDEDMPDLIETIKRDAIWSCTTCGSCEENCPVLNEYVQMFVDFRRYLAMMEGDFPSELNNTFRNLENKGNPWGLPMGERDNWAEGLDVPRIQDNPDAEYLLFIGCADAYDDAYMKVSRAMVKILNAAGVSYGILGTEETCTGDSARRLGNEFLYQMLAMQNIETFNGYNIKKIITICPHCLQTIGNEYPDMGGNYEVLHHAQLLDTLLKEGKIKLTKPMDKKMMYHDSCYLGRYNDIYKQPRDILKSVPGATLVEADRSHEDGFCCGAGGGFMWLEEDKGERMNIMRTDQLLEKKPDIIASACPFCKVMIKDGVAHREQDDNVKVKDIAEIVADLMAD